MVINEGKPVVWLFLYIRYLHSHKHKTLNISIFNKALDIDYNNTKNTYPASCASWALITDSKLLFTKKSQTAE